MLKQRTCFFGERPVKGPKRSGPNQPVSERRFRAVPVIESGYVKSVALAILVLAGAVTWLAATVIWKTSALTSSALNLAVLSVLAVAFYQRLGFRETGESRTHVQMEWLSQSGS